LLTGVPALLIFVLLPGAIVRILMGGQYAEFASLLPLLSVAIFIVAFVNLVVSYYMALRHYAIALVVIAGAAITYILMYFHHATLREVIVSLLLGSLSMLVVGAGLLAGRRLLKNKRG